MYIYIHILYTPAASINPTIIMKTCRILHPSLCRNSFQEQLHGSRPIAFERHTLEPLYDTIPMYTYI